VWHLYLTKVLDGQSTDDATNVSLESMPPTTDAHELHMSRENYQTKVWLQAYICHMSVGQGRY